MKPQDHPFFHRIKLGLYYETTLKPALEQAVGVPLTKTSEETDTMDFEGENCFIELKARSDQYHYTQWFIKKDGWLLPTCKIKRALEEVRNGKQVVFFYFWVAGKTLWRWDFKEEDLNDVENKFPPWHRDYQQQSYVKEHHWIQVY